MKKMSNLKKVEIKFQEIIFDVWPQLNAMSNQYAEQNKTRLSGAQFGWTSPDGVRYIAELTIGKIRIPPGVLSDPGKCEDNRREIQKKLDLYKEMGYGNDLVVGPYLDHKFQDEQLVGLSHDGLSLSVWRCVRMAD